MRGGTRCAAWTSKASAFQRACAAMWSDSRTMSRTWSSLQSAAARASSLLLQLPLKIAPSSCALSVLERSNSRPCCSVPVPQPLGQGACVVRFSVSVCQPYIIIVIVSLVICAQVPGSLRGRGVCARAAVHLRLLPGRVHRGQRHPPAIGAVPGDNPAGTHAFAGEGVEARPEPLPAVRTPFGLEHRQTPPGALQLLFIATRERALERLRLVARLMGEMHLAEVASMEFLGRGGVG